MIKLNTWQIKRAVRCLRQEGIIAYPTEAVYGLGCNPYNRQVVQRLLMLKQRRWQKGLILIASDYSQLAEFLEPLTVELHQRVFPTWPGPVTWLLPAKPSVPRWLRGCSPLLAVRVTAHPVAKALCRAYGHALVSTSANRGGNSPAKTAFQVRCLFGSRLIGYFVPGQVGDLPRPTEIRNALTNSVLRF